THFLTKASLAALLALCTIPATVSTSAAAGPQTNFVVEAQYHRPIRGFSPMHAVRKARDFGLRRAHITRMSSGPSALCTIQSMSGSEAGGTRR
ncbi:hypothetical protein AB9F39_35680, partial [Rhizobium leguminosarum]|uniref:hypothetical protein n=1 Tax=Rhizobium leguminosarum TaxID=384 RepID=UPI003F9536FA